MNPNQLLKTFATFVLVLAVAATATAQRSRAPKAAPAPADDSNLMDVNSAPAEKLMTLPGIDLVLAKKIIEHRPYRSANELSSKKVIPQSAYESIARKITVKGDGTKSTAAKPAAAKTRNRRR